MKKTFTLVALTALMAFNMMADINTDKAMSQIARDTQTYISADVRASNEDEAYRQALELLTNKIADYYKEEYPNMPIPDKVYLSGMSGIYDRITSQINDKRYRVMLYVHKADLYPMDANGSAVILSKTSGSGYSVMDMNQKPDTVYVTDTVRIAAPVPQPAEEPFAVNPTAMKVASQKTLAQISSLLPQMKKDGEITGAAAFPIASANEFYVVVLDDNGMVKCVLLNKNDRWRNARTGEPADIGDFAGCSAYWFTLPN